MQQLHSETAAHYLAGDAKRCIPALWRVDGRKLSSKVVVRRSGARATRASTPKNLSVARRGALGVVDPTPPPAPPRIMTVDTVEGGEEEGQGGAEYVAGAELRLESKANESWPLKPAMNGGAVSVRVGARVGRCGGARTLYLLRGLRSLG